MIDYERSNPHDRDPLALAESLTPERLMALPELPVALEAREDGAVYVQELQLRANELPQRSNGHLFRLSPIGADRMAELDAVAKQLSGEDTDALQFFTQLVDGAAVLAAENIPLFLKHRLRPLPTTTSDMLRRLREGALEKRYADKLIDYARQALAAHMPESLPHEPTAGVVVTRSDGAHSYRGRFGNKHLVTFSTKRLTPARIEEVSEDSEAVLHAAHELAHQAHGELEGDAVNHIGWPDATPFNQEDVTDPWQVFRLYQEYEGSTPHAERSPHDKLADKVISMVHETVAYTVEEELRQGMGCPSLFEHVSPTSYIPSESRHWVDAIDHFLMGTDSAQRRELYIKLRQIDLTTIRALPDRVLKGIIEGPQELLYLAKKQ